jgi:salicylate hydroxylase
MLKNANNHYSQHILTFPIQNATVINVVAFATDRSRPVGQRQWKHGLWVEPVAQAELLAEYVGWGNAVLGLLSVKPRHTPPL